MIPRWEAHERALRDLAAADLTAGPGWPVPTLLLFDADEADLLVRARVEGVRDGCDHLSEMAAVVAARRPRRVAWSVPGAARHLSGSRQEEPVARVLVCSSVEHRDGAWHHRARLLPYRVDAADPVLGPATDVEVELSPVGSLLDDVVRHPSGHDPVRILSVLTAWGHEVAIPAERADGGSAPWLPVVDGSERHRTRRLARELSRRHDPTAPVDAAHRRPAVVTDIPPGWEPACPL